MSIESIYIGGFTHKERTASVGMYILEYMDRSYMVTRRRRVVVVSLISYPYGD